MKNEKLKTENEKRETKMKNEKRKKVQTEKMQFTKRKISRLIKNNCPREFKMSESVCERLSECKSE